MAEDRRITRSKGNVFEDLGLPEAAEKKAKVKLTVALNEAIAEKRLRQHDVANILNCTQPEVSALANYKLAGFSLARLMEFLTDLDRDVEISIRKTNGHGHIVVRELEPA
jgi:predicted XRE-type DNA-binding protein